MKNAYLIFALACMIQTFHNLYADTVPGTIISHLPAEQERYIGSPSICILPDGTYVASHDEFGPKSNEFKSAVSRIYISEDKGLTWKRIGQIDGQFWSVLFNMQDTLYILGTNRHHGNVVLRKSNDKGKTWSVPYDGKHGLLLEGEYHMAPTPVLRHGGRIWKAMEYATAKTTKWGERYSAMMLSAPIGSDLLDARNWTRSNHLYYNMEYLDGNFGGWLEGNAVYSEKDGVIDILRVHVPAGYTEMCAVANVSEDGKKMTFDKRDFFPMPGASKKFSIKYDSATGLYMALLNEVPDSLSGNSPDKIRNTVSLYYSENLQQWHRAKVVLHHPDHLKHGFQYIDWLIDGEDIVFVSRTSYDDETGGAHNNHDANYLTFHRIKNYREIIENALGKSGNHK